MNNENALRIEVLCEEYLSGYVDLKRFQVNVEPLLGNYEIISKEDELFIRNITNEIEVLIFCFPEDVYREQMISIIHRILHYSKSKKDF